MNTLTIKEIETIIRRDENRILEVKKTTGEIVAGMQSGCAFLNTEGGWLLFGITPDSLKIIGQEVVDRTMQEIAREMTKFSPAIDLAAQYIDLTDNPDKKVIAIWFPAPVGYTAPYTYDGRPFYKVENTTKQMPREMFDERIRLSDPKKFSWEKTPCIDADIKNISAKSIDEVISSGINKGRIPREAASLKSRQAKLDHFGLRTKEGELTNAAIALFGNSPAKIFTQCKVRLARFEGKDMDKFRDQTVCYGNLFEQYDAIIDFCRKHMFLAGDMDQKERIDTLTLPYKALREATLNLLVHRTWWSGSRTPSIAIFDDRIEFMNPGNFPHGTTADDFRKRPHSEPVNEVISEVFFKSGLMEAWGRGIPDIFGECKAAGLPKPVFEVVPGFVCLTIRFKNPLAPYLNGRENEGINEGVNDGANEGVNDLDAALKQVYSIIKTTPGIKTNQISDKIGRSTATVERYLSALKKKDLIEHRGSAKTGGYYVK